MEKSGDQEKINLNSDGYNITLRKESNKAAARRSRLKKKNAEHYNSEVRRKLQEENAKLLVENNLLRHENERLNAILDAHKNCPIDVSTKDGVVEYSRTNHRIEEGGNFATFSHSSYTPSLALPCAIFQLQLPSKHWPHLSKVDSQ